MGDTIEITVAAHGARDRKAVPIVTADEVVQDRTMDAREGRPRRRALWKRVAGQVWLLLSAFGICFALLSGLQEIGRGETMKASAAVVLGVVIYLGLGRTKRE